MVLSDKTTLFLRRSMSSFFLSTVHQWIRSLFSKSPTLTWPMYKAQHSIGGTASADLIFARRGGPRHRHCGIFHHIAACATPSLPSHTATTGICTDHFFLTTGLARKDKKRGRPIWKAISCLEFPQAIQVVAVIDLGLHRRVDHDASKGIASLATTWPWAWCFEFGRVRSWNGTPTMCFVDDFTTILRRLFLWVLMISRRHSNLFILSLILTGRSQHFVGCMYSHVIECYWLSNIST